MPRTGWSTSGAGSAEPKAAVRDRLSGLQVLKRWSTVHSTPCTGWSESTAEVAKPKAAANNRRSELQVQKLRSTVHSTHRTGWSTSRAKSAEPKGAARNRHPEWPAQDRRSTVHSTPDYNAMSKDSERERLAHYSGKKTIDNVRPSGAKNTTVHPPPTKTSQPSDVCWGSRKRVRHPEITPTASKRAVARESTAGAVTMADIDGQKPPVKRNSYMKTEVQLSL